MTTRNTKTVAEQAAEALLNAIHQEGYEAGRDGVSLRDNPQTPGTALARAWDAGWMQATSDNREARRYGFGI